jgi:RimJ/RimL family protein N-acetyltransferase
VTPDLAVALNASIATEHLILEPITEAHADVLFLPMLDDRIYAWISAVPPATVERLRAYWAIAESRVTPSGDEARLNWVVCRRSDGTYVGKCDAEVDAAGVATNIGYILFSAFWGLGYATEAVNGMVSHFAQFGITELRALVTSGNDASARVLLKCGFIRTRIIPENDTIRGLKYDDVEYVRYLNSGDEHL